MNSRHNYFLVLVLSLVAVPVSVQAQKKPHSKHAKKPPVTRVKLRAVQSIMPKVGSVFINFYYLVDSVGNRVPSSIADPDIHPDTQIVVASGVSGAGRDRVVKLTGPGHTDTTFLAYELNGDVSIYNTQRRGSVWELLPFGGVVGKSLHSPTINETVEVTGQKIPITRHSESRVLGWDNVGVDDVPVPCVMLQITTIAHEIGGKKGSSVGAPESSSVLYWYAPSLGYFMRMGFPWGQGYFLNQQVHEIHLP